MAAISHDEIQRLLRPYILSETGLANPEHSQLLDQLSTYLDLVMRWNGRMNLTAIRDPRQIIQRHFGESLFAAQHLPNRGTILDLGSGAGFPGVPIQLWHAEQTVTLAESQSKKATFLREVVRSLSLPTEVWSGRAEGLAPGRKFDAVVMRAVDDSGRALKTAFELTAGDVWVLGSSALIQFGLGQCITRIALPDSQDSWLLQFRR